MPTYKIPDLYGISSKFGTMDVIPDYVSARAQRRFHIGHDSGLGQRMRSPSRLSNAPFG
jgi:hypothetical protein